MIPLRIHRMSAIFGKLDQETLELSDGLNILHAPNETGKSTWCAFLLSMLYGINSRERDKAGFIADKNRYAPWSGVSMSGRLDCRAGGGELTLLRETKRQTAPMGDFKATYTGTGDPVPGLTGANCGEMLLGVTREVYERSAFIRQAGLAISQDAGLEKRIAALITTGQEDTSYSEAADTLKKQLNRRRHAKTGQLPVLENELAETNRQLEALSALENRLVQARREADGLAAREQALRDQLACHDRWDAAQAHRVLAELETAAAEAEQSAAALRRQAEDSHLPENETIARLRGAIVNLETLRKSVNKAMAEKDDALRASVKAETAVSESPFAGKTVDEARREASALPAVRTSLSPSRVVLATLATLCFGLAVFALGWKSGYGFAIQGTASGILFALGAGCICLLWQLCLRDRARTQEAALMKRYGVATPAEIAALADAYAALYQAHIDAQNAVVKATGVYDGLYASLNSNEQGILLEVRRFAPAAFDIPAADAALRECAVRRRDLNAAQAAAQAARMRWELQGGQAAAAPVGEPPPPPEQSRESLQAGLTEVQAGLSAARSAADHIAGQIAAMGDRAALAAQAERLAAQIELLEGEYSAIALAMETLEAANAELQTRFSPELGRRTAEIFAQLTGGRYTGVVLDRSLRLSAEPAGDAAYRDIQLLSAGAADQLYLAARLAICALVLPEEDAPPLVLDDALANFDDDRCKTALEWLKEAAKKRQILLFTCHSREAAYFEKDGEVSVQRLTGHTSGV